MEGRKLFSYFLADLKTCVSPADSFTLLFRNDSCTTTTKITFLETLQCLQGQRLFWKGSNPELGRMTDTWIFSLMRF